jgi:hypothetical protein
MAMVMGFSFPVFAEMYFWTDDQGVKHYSNKKPPESIDKFKAEPEIDRDQGLDKSSVDQEQEAAELDRQVKILKKKDEREQSNWLREKQQEEARQLEKEERRKAAMAHAKARVQSLEKRLERYEEHQRKHRRKYAEDTIRSVREELYEAKKALRTMELHGDFSAVE